MDLCHSRSQFIFRDDNEVRFVMFEAVQDEHPQVSSGHIQFRGIQRKPTQASESLLHFGRLVRQEVLAVFDLQRNCAAVFAVGDEQIYARVFCWQPKVESREAVLEMQACQVFSGVNREHWPHRESNQDTTSSQPSILLPTLRLIR